MRGKVQKTKKTVGQPKHGKNSSKQEKQGLGGETKDSPPQIAFCVPCVLLYCLAWKRAVSLLCARACSEKSQIELTCGLVSFSCYKTWNAPQRPESGKGFRTLTFMILHLKQQYTTELCERISNGKRLIIGEAGHIYIYT